MSIAGSVALKSSFARACAVLSIVAAFASASQAQAGRQVSVVRGQFDGCPVELVAVDVSGEAHAFAGGGPREFPSASFDAPEDWLRGVAVRIKNRSDRTLVFANITGTLAVGEPGEIPMGIDFLFGRGFDESSFTGRPPLGVARSLAPGETAEVTWTEPELARMEKFLATKHAVADYRRMRLEVREAHYDDGTAWSSGRLYRVDPNDPRKWTPLDGKPFGFGESPAALKPGERVLEVSSYKPASDPEVLAISEIRIAGQPVTPNRAFAAGEDWLRTLTVRVRNISAKPITYVQLNFGLPEAAYHAGGLGFSLQYGRDWTPPSAPVADVRPLLPGEERELSFTDETYESRLDYSRKMSGVTSFSRVRMGGASVQFADGARALVITLPQKSGEPK
ncbi:MAG: hypothetical protein M3268_08825 [Acidobacteriota bacterium]|nr:hypothetical protein [Acidobacteriota bacterium]